MTMQARWRAVGLGSLIAAGLMAWFGTAGYIADSLVVTLGYWLVFMSLLIIAFYSVLLDIRYIRLEYKVGERQIWRDTFDNEAFRQALAAELEQKRREDEQKQRQAPPSS